MIVNSAGHMNLAKIYVTAQIERLFESGKERIL